MTDVLLVYITTPDQAESKRIAKILIEEKLAACANILPTIDSVYYWQGELKQNNESLLLLKTHREVFDSLMERAQELHPYDLPCIVALPLCHGIPGFLNWVAEEVDAK
jgi:Uncharacterized protein involved in tolerance to divalent cations